MAPAFKKHFDEGLVRRWVKALRSRRYKRTSGRLSQGYGQVERNCCLGVACRVAALRDPRWRENGYLSDTGYTDEVRKRLGISLHLERKLANMNDAGRTFPEIADLIESELL